MFPLTNKEPYIMSTGERTTLGDILTKDDADIEQLKEALTDEVETRAELGAHNLLPNVHDTDTIGGITFTKNSDGSVTANGTNTSGATVSYYISSSSDINANLSYSEGTYILTGAPSGGGSAGNYKWFLSLFYNKNAANNYGTFDFGSGATYTITNSNNTGVGARIGIAAGQTVENLTFKPMLRLAVDADPTYQPYAMTNKELTDASTVKSGTITFAVGTAHARTYLQQIGHMCLASFQVNSVTLSKNADYQTIGTVSPKPKKETMFVIIADAKSYRGLLDTSGNIKILVNSTALSSDAIIGQVTYIV